MYYLALYNFTTTQLHYHPYFYLHTAISAVIAAYHGNYQGFSLKKKSDKSAGVCV